MAPVSKGPWLDDDEQKAWRSYLLMHRTLKAHLERHLQRDFGLSGSDFEILVNLSESESGRMRAFELSRATQWEKSLAVAPPRPDGEARADPQGGLRLAVPGDRRHRGRPGGDQGVRATQAALVRQFFVDVFGPDRLAVLGEVADEIVGTIGTHCDTDCPLEARS